MQALTQDVIDRWVVQARTRIGIGIPVPVEHLIEVLQLAVATSEHLPDGYDGACQTFPDGARVVLIRAGLPQGRHRWTLAHEIGHCLIDKYLRREHILHGRRTNLSRGYEERMADRFAKQLLMPEPDVTLYYYTMVGRHRDPIPPLAAKFAVSRQAMTIRIKELLLGRQW